MNLAVNPLEVIVPQQRGNCEPDALLRFVPPIARPGAEGERLVPSLVVRVVEPVLLITLAPFSRPGRHLSVRNSPARAKCSSDHCIKNKRTLVNHGTCYA